MNSRLDNGTGGGVLGVSDASEEHSAHDNVILNGGKSNRWSDLFRGKLTAKDTPLSFVDPILKNGQPIA